MPSRARARAKEKEEAHLGRVHYTCQSSQILAYENEASGADKKEQEIHSANWTAFLGGVPVTCVNTSMAESACTPGGLAHGMKLEPP